MPRKASTIPPAVRIRENQRRARARRKDLIDDLKRKVRAFEIQGVKATAQVQEAARRVLLENEGLRALLAEKGASTAEIRSYLHEFVHDAPITTVLPTSKPIQKLSPYIQTAPSLIPRQQKKMQVLDTPSQLVSVASLLTVPLDAGLKNATQASNNGEFIESHNKTEQSQPSDRSDEDLERGSPLENLLSPVSDYYSPEMEPTPEQGQTSETECSVAANIIASFKGHENVEQALVELGCHDTAQCSIKNTALFSALL